MYDNLIKELRDQVTHVDVTLAIKVKLIEECIFLLENELLAVRFTNEIKLVT